MNASESRAPRNRMLTLSAEDRDRLRPRLAVVEGPITLNQCVKRTILGDALRVLPFLPPESVDLVIVDPPYNLTKTYADTISIDSSRTCRQWMMEFCDAVLEFYPRERARINDRIVHFERVREFRTSKSG